MAEFENLIYEKEDGRARITLNRPEKLNALSIALQRELNAAMREADNDTDVHCVILRGAGRAFSAGYDLTAGGRGNGDETYANVYRGRVSLDDDYLADGAVAAATHDHFRHAQTGHRTGARLLPGRRHRRGAVV
ncbi:MAG TPA: enoyl-CoA hydratase/isomerase family protein [Dehalococcoidia bacterium]